MWVITQNRRPINLSQAAFVTVRPSETEGWSKVIAGYPGGDAVQLITLHEGPTQDCENYINTLIELIATREPLFTIEPAQAK